MLTHVAPGSRPRMTGEEGAAYATDEMKRAGVGFREHTGWAAMVALGGGVRAPVVLARNRYELSEGDLPRAVYHAARQLDLENAERLVRQVELVARTAAERQLRRTLAELEAGGYEVVGAAIAAARELPAHLTEILGSHPLVHTAEGQLYRDALAEATELLGLPLTRFVQHELYEEAADHIGTSDASLQAQLTGLGRALGPPWQRDQKEAAAAAWLALASSGRSQPAEPAQPRVDQPGTQAARR
jgi:hypothetical protein